MATMGRYCKAYPIQRFQEYPNWPGELPAPVAAEGEEPIEGDHYYFLQENHTVTRDIFLEDVVFAEGTEEWRRFCRDVLAFEVPSDVLAMSADADTAAIS